MQLHERTASDLLLELERGTLTATDVAKSSLAQVKAHDSKVKAFLNVNEESILAQAAAVDAKRKAGQKVGKLAGIPVALKDNLCVRGDVTTCASKILQTFRPPYSAHVVERLVQEDAILFGKCNLDEFAMGSSTENSAYQTTGNPWNVEFTPGGSSGGSAAAVAASFTPLSLGSDTGGSIRQPASFCGIAGMKPTYGRVSRYGLVAFASSLDQIGPLSHDLRDQALLMEVIAGHDPRDSTSVNRDVPQYSKALDEPIKNLTIGVPKEFFQKGLDGEVDAAVQSALKTYEKLGAKLKPVSLPNTEYAVAVYYIVATAEASSNLARYDGVHYGHRAKKFDSMIHMYSRSRGEGFGKEVQRRIMLGTYALSSGYYDAYYKKALQVRRLIKNDYDAVFQDCDVIMGPVAPTPAFKIGEKKDDPLAMYLSDIYTISCNLAGNVGLSINCGQAKNGMPIGLQLLGKEFDEEKVLRIGRMFEKETDWHLKRAKLAQSDCSPAGAGHAVRPRPEARDEKCTSQGKTMSETALPYKIVVGLEVHVQLLTRTKLFCSCTTQFGLPPNTATCPICIGMPGVLPVMNRKAFELGMKAALALNCNIARHTKWDRKNYYYPDLPKNYQISQYDLPMSYEGFLEITTEAGTKKVGIIRAHLEEDAGKMMHDESGRGKDSMVDLNRAGTPLLEIVSHPHINTGDEVKAYLEEIRLLLREIGASDCEMQEGSLRVDANVNVNFLDDGKKVATPIVEVKNVNSIRAVERAVMYEAQRQYEQYKVDKVTMNPTNKVTAKWIDEQGRTEVLRRKEEAADYRYFPEPDLVTVEVDDTWLETVKNSLGELPSQRRVRFVNDYQILESAAKQMVGEGVAFCNYFEATAKASGDTKLASNWCLNQVLQTLNDKSMTIDAFPLDAAKLGSMITQIKKYNINMARSRDVFAQMMETGDTAEAIVKKLGLDVTFDPAQLREMVKKSIAGNPKAVADVKAGKTKAIDSLMGPVMRDTKGKAPMDLVRTILQEELQNVS